MQPQALIPRWLHRMLLPIAHVLRHSWRRVRRAQLRGCNVILRDHSGAILLVRHSYGGDCWMLPGGGIAKSEDPEQAARREVFEELGCGLENMRLLGTLDEVISACPHQVYIYAGQAAGPIKIDGRELIEARYFAPDDLPDNLGRFTPSRLTLLNPTQK